MKTAIVIAPGVGLVHGLAGPAHRVAQWVADRIANGCAYPGERVIRLPRRVRVVGMGRIVRAGGVA